MHVRNVSQTLLKSAFMTPTSQTGTCCSPRGGPPCASCGPSCGHRSPWQRNWPQPESGKSAGPLSFFTGLPAKTDTTAASPAAASSLLHLQDSAVRTSALKLGLWARHPAAAGCLHRLHLQKTPGCDKDFRAGQRHGKVLEVSPQRSSWCSLVSSWDVLQDSSSLTHPFLFSLPLNLSTLSLFVWFYLWLKSIWIYSSPR